VLAAACQVEVGVGVTVEHDGTGEVRVAVALDEEVAAQAPRLADQLEVDDLTGAGWTVTGPTVERDGRTWVRASRPFASPDEAAALLDQIGGPNGAFHDFRIERSRTFWAEHWHLVGGVDLTAGLAGFSDDALRERLDGASFGFTDDELVRRAGQPLDRAVRFRVDAELPGAVTSNGPVDVDGRAVWLPVLGEETALDARSRALDGRRAAAFTVAAMAGVAALVIVGRRLANRHR
jgi:hypothetical protein